MELKQLWAVLVRRWWLIVLPALVALVLTLPSLRQVFSAPPSYQVTVRFTASQIPSADSGNNFQDQSYIPWLASEYAVNNLATWMRTQSFAQEIADELAKQGSTFDPAAIQGAIATDSARSIMTLIISWPDADQIQAIGKAAIDVLQNRSQAYFPQFAAQKVVITPQDSVTPVPVSASLTTRFSPLVRVGVGLLVGLALAFLVEYLDPTIRGRMEIEALNLPIIAEIPRW